MDAGGRVQQGTALKLVANLDARPNPTIAIPRRLSPSPITSRHGIRAADAVIIITPEYNYSIPGALKNAIDWVSRLPDQPFKEKPVAIQSPTGGLLGGARMQYHLRQAMIFLNAFSFGTQEIFVGQAPTKFDEKTLELKDEITKKLSR